MIYDKNSDKEFIAELMERGATEEEAKRAVSDGWPATLKSLDELKGLNEKELVLEAILRGWTKDDAETTIKLWREGGSKGNLAELFNFIEYS